MVRRIKKSQILRHFIQLTMFCALPGLYVMTFNEIKTFYQMIIKANFNFLQILPSLTEFIAITLLTVLMGRWFCGWVCAFGAYNDLIYFISKQIFKVKFEVDEKVDSILKYAKYIVLLFIIIVSWTFGSDALKGASPWDVFGQITSIPSIVSDLLIGLILLVLITIGAAFIERFFCRYLCPLGAVFSIISRFGVAKINKPKAECGKCSSCTMNCSMGINLYKVNDAKGGECISCLNCTEICFKKNAKLKVMGQDLNPNLAGAATIALMLGAYGLTDLGAKYLVKTGVISSNSAILSENSSQKYKDGIYIGSGEGIRGETTKISVTITNGKIINIETLSTGDDNEYFDKASETIIKEILSKQSTEVDTVSGATYSSKGIINAVTNALIQAK